MAKLRFILAYLLSFIRCKNYSNAFSALLSSAGAFLYLIYRLYIFSAGNSPVRRSSF